MENGEIEEGTAVNDNEKDNVDCTSGEQHIISFWKRYERITWIRALILLCALLLLVVVLVVVLTTTNNDKGQEDVSSETTTTSSSSFTTLTYNTTTTPSSSPSPTIPSNMGNNNNTQQIISRVPSISVNTTTTTAIMIDTQPGTSYTVPWEEESEQQQPLSSSLSPQPTATTSCTNTPNYTDMYGDTCTFYETTPNNNTNKSNPCLVYGTIGDIGKTPNENCCVCKEKILVLEVQEQEEEVDVVVGIHQNVETGQVVVEQQNPTPTSPSTLSYDDNEKVNYTSSISTPCINTPNYKDVYGDTCEQYEIESNFPQYCKVYGDDGGDMSPNLHCCVCKQVLMSTTDELPTLRPGSPEPPTSSPVIVTNSPTTLSPTTMSPTTKEPTSKPVMTNRPTEQPTVTTTCILIQTGTNVYDGGYIDVTIDIGTGYGYYPISTPGKRYTEGEMVVDECFTSTIEGLRVTAASSRTINPDAWVGSILYSKSSMNDENQQGEYYQPFTCVDSCDLFASNLATSIVVDGDEYDSSEKTMARCTNGNVCTLLSDEFCSKKAAISENYYSYTKDQASQCSEMVGSNIDHYQGPAPYPNNCNVAIQFYVFADTPYDSKAKTCILPNGTQDYDCTLFDCAGGTNLPSDNTCTYEGAEFQCIRDTTVPYMNNKISAGEASFVAYVGDFIDGSAGVGLNNRCTEYSFTSRRDLFSEVSNFIIVPGDNDWNECSGYDRYQNTDPPREMWRRHFADKTSPFNKFGKDFPGGGRPTVHRATHNPELYFFSHAGVAFFGITKPSRPHYISDYADEDINMLWVEEKLGLDEECQFKSIVIISHTMPRDSLYEKIEGYFDSCNFVLPILTVKADRHPRKYCMESNSDNSRLTVTAEAFRSGPLLLSVVRDPRGGGDFFHVDDVDTRKSNSVCPDLI